MWQAVPETAIATGLVFQAAQPRNLLPVIVRRKDSKRVLHCLDVVQKALLAFVSCTTSQKQYIKPHETNVILQLRRENAWEPSKTPALVALMMLHTVLLSCGACLPPTLISLHCMICIPARRYVYERMVQPGRQPGSAAMLATILVSSFWHGLNIGYFMFFVGWFAFAKHSTVLYKCERAYMPSWAAKSWWWWVIKLVITQQCSVFLLQSFALLTWRDSIAAWASVYYSPLLYIVSVLALGMVVPVKRGAHSSGRSEGVGAKKHDGQSSSIGTIHAKPCVHGHVKDL